MRLYGEANQSKQPNDPEESKDHAHDLLNWGWKLRNQVGKDEPINNGSDEDLN